MVRSRHLKSAHDHLFSYHPPLLLSMAIRWFLPLLMGLAVLASEQHILTNEDTQTGVLRRFSVTGSSIEDILRVASVATTSSVTLVFWR